MPKSHPTGRIIAIAAAVTLASGAALAAGDAAGGRAPHVTRTERHEFTRLSKDGQLAYADITEARLAIFDGDPGKAGTLITDASSALDRAQTDDTAFMKSVSEMHPPKSVPNPAPGTGASDDQPRAWIPVDQQYVLDETFAPTASSRAAAEAANHQLSGGHPDQAAETLRLASVGATDTVMLAPLDATVDDVHRAGQLMSAQDYYGASQALRQAVLGVRFDTIDVVTPSGKRLAANGAANGTAAATTRTTGHPSAE